jgi:hypothetical protein
VLDVGDVSPKYQTEPSSARVEIVGHLLDASVGYAVYCESSVSTG